MTSYAPFEAADYFDSEEVIAEYLSAAADDANPDVFLVALGDVARARDMAQIAKASGLGRDRPRRPYVLDGRPRNGAVQGKR